MRKLNHKIRKGGSSSNLSKKALSVIFLFYRRYFSNPYISTILLYSSKLFAVEVSLVWMYTLPSRVTRSRCKYLIVRIFFLAKRILIKKMHFSKLKMQIQRRNAEKLRPWTEYYTSATTLKCAIRCNEIESYIPVWRCLLTCGVLSFNTYL